MKKHTFGAALGAILLLSAGCGDNTGVEAIKFPLDRTFTTKLPVDPGTIHNEILTEMDAASIPAGTLTSGEYLDLLVAAANRAFSRYGASRKLTIDDCRAALDIGRAVSPLYDFRFKDPSRADPMKAIRYWHDHGLLNDQEFIQLEQVFGETTVEKERTMAMSVASEPASEVVAAGVSVFQASIDYWSRPVPLLSVEGTGPQRGDADEIRRTLADGLGGIIGSIFGGPIGGGLVGTGLSILFLIQEECWPGPCGGDDPSPVRDDPCDGYRGAGPCPD